MMNLNQTLNAVDILHWKEHQLYQLLEDHSQIHWYNVKFDNEIIQMSTATIIVSWHLWLPFRYYKFAKLKKEHCITKEEWSKWFQQGDDASLRKMELIIKNIVDDYIQISDDLTEVYLNKEGVFYTEVLNESNQQKILEYKRDLRFNITEMCYTANSNIYNMYVNQLDFIMPSISYIDVCEIVNHNLIKEAKTVYINTIKEHYSYSSIKKAEKALYKVVNSFLLTQEGLDHNGIIQMTRSGFLSLKQLQQLFGTRGFTTDIKNHVFQHPINNSYVDGLSSAYDFVVESFSASRSVIANEASLEDSEEFNKMCRFLGSYIHSVHGLSCSHYKTMDTLVTENDRIYLNGKFYMKNGRPQKITKTNFNDLIDTVIPLRSFVGCNNHDPQTICFTCLGDSYFQIPFRTNAGYHLIQEIIGRISQAMMRTKHILETATHEKLHIDKYSSKFIMLGEHDNSRVQLTQWITSQNPIIRIDLKINNLHNLNIINNVNPASLSVYNISNIHEIEIAPGNSNGDITGPFNTVHLAINKVGGFMTTELLLYLKQHGWKSNKKYVEFQLKDWNFKIPLFGLPEIGYNPAFLLNEVKGFINPAATNFKNNITSYNENPAGAISELGGLFRNRLNTIHISEVEIFIRSLMTKGIYNFDLPKANDDFMFQSLTRILTNRSLMGMLAYERHSSLIEPKWFLPGKSTSHFYDRQLFE